MAFYVDPSTFVRSQNRSYKFFKRFLLVFIVLNILGSMVIGVIGYSILDERQKEGHSVDKSAKVSLIASVALAGFLSLFGLLAIVKEHPLLIFTFAACMAILVVTNLFDQLIGVTIVNIVIWTSLACFSASFALMARRVRDYEQIA